MKKKAIYFISLALSLFLAIACNNSNKDVGKDSVEGWLKSRSCKIETLELTDQQSDLKLLGEIVGDAKVVCLGESRHDLREQFQLKHRFIKYLVEKLDFSIFILEASLPYSDQINSYIQNGEGNIAEIMANMPGWFLWDTEEILAVFEWMRSYNSNPDNFKKLKFYGIDIVAPGYGLSLIFEYLKKVDNRAFVELQALDFAQDRIVDQSWQTTFQEFSSLPPGEKGILRENYLKLYDGIMDNESAYAAQSGDEEYQWILRLAYCANQACRMFTAESKMDVGLIRDSAMANNAIWINRTNSRDDKSIIWAHNLHITKGEFKMTGFQESIKGMGYILGQEFGSDIVSIGASFNKGEFENWGRTFPPAAEHTGDAMLARTGLGIGLIDLTKNNKNEAVSTWLNSEQVLLGQEVEMIFIPSKSFDAIYFIDKVSRTIPNKESLERFRNMN